MSNWQSFLQDWQTWNPKRMEDALHKPITCQRRRCKHTFAPIDVIDMERVSIKCPQCNAVVLNSILTQGRGDGLVCASCRVEAPTKYATIRQNIGMLVVRRHGEVAGRMCKRCIRRHFWPMTATTIAVGWIGVQSIFIAPLYVLGNLGAYAKTIGMKKPSPGATRPSLTEEKLASLAPFLGEVMTRLGAGDPRLAVAKSISSRSDATPFEALSFIHFVLQTHLTDIVHRHRTGQG